MWRLWVQNKCVLEQTGLIHEQNVNNNWLNLCMENYGISIRTLNNVQKQPLSEG